MRKNVRGEERDTTTHLIETHVFTHASCVTKFSIKVTKELGFVAARCWFCPQYKTAVMDSDLCSPLPVKLLLRSPLVAIKLKVGV